MLFSFRPLLLGLCAATLVAAEKPVPRLAVVITVDQMRADYLVRFRPYFTGGGFERLLEGGADYRDCHYRHGYTKTAPGHATILSGVHADVHGIIGNEWLDPVTFIQGNSVEDADSPLVGLPPRTGRHPNAILEAKSGRSPRNFLGTTVGDRLKERHGPAAKVFGVADKDRSAILTAGAKADGAYWTEEGRFVTSTWYRRELPAWVEQFNTDHGAAKYFGRTWDRLLDKSVYDTVQGPDDAPGERAENGLPVTFPKRVDGGRTEFSGAFYGAFDQTPWDNQFVADMAERLIDAEELGQDDTTDLLCIGFSQPDKAGHAYGPDSHEIMDSILRLDRTLAGFIDYLDKKVGLVNCVIVVTADHGVCPLPESRPAAAGMDAPRRISGSMIDAHVKTALDATFGPLPENLYWAVRDGGSYRLNPAALAAMNLQPARVAGELRSALLAFPGIAAAWTRDQLTDPAPLGQYGEMMRLSYHPPRSGEVVYIFHPYFLDAVTGTNHGTPYDYDTHVPQVWFGAGVKPGVHLERAGVDDLAPTLAGLLGVDLPPEAKGRRLF